MDLLREVLLRLPAPRVAEIAPELLREVVKYLNRGKIPPETIDRYIEALREYSSLTPEIFLLCLQGLMTPDAEMIIPPRMLINRAAFLQDKVSYLNLAENYPGDNPYAMYQTRILRDLSLISDVPEIQAAMLTIFRESIANIHDPEWIRWTSGLVRYYSERFSGLRYELEDNQDSVWLAGYLHVALSKDHPRLKKEYLTGYLTREMQTYPDPFVDSEHLNELLQKMSTPLDRLTICMETGYFPKLIFTVPMEILIKSALQKVQPKFIRRYLPETRKFLADSNIYVRCRDKIRYTMRERAEEMLALLEPDLRPDSEYLLSLRILTGRRIDPDLVTKLLLEWPDLNGKIDPMDDTPALMLMASVLHPQVPDQFFQFYDLNNIQNRYSSISYDLAHYFKARVKAGLDTNLVKFTQLYSLGKVLEAYPPDAILSLMETINILGGPGRPPISRTEFSRQYQEILRAIQSTKISE